MKISELLKWDTWGLFNSNRFYSYKIFIAKELPRIEKIDLLQEINSHPVIPDFNLNKVIKFTKVRSESDFILVPHNWVQIHKNYEYLAYLTSLSYDTPIIILNNGDISPKATLPNTLELRTFLHPWENSFRKIVLPYAVKARKFSIREWKPVPTITFMGYIPTLSLGSLLGKNLRGLTAPIKSSVYLNRNISTFKLKHIGSKFKVEIEKRKEFTAYRSNPNLQLHMKEFQQSLDKSDYVMCPRGAGNFSVRFYEVLSSGATPLLIESGSELPIVTQNEFWGVNVINLRLFENWSTKIMNDWLNLQINDNYIKRQISNREIFLNELNIKSYILSLFKNYLR